MFIRSPWDWYSQINKVIYHVLTIYISEINSSLIYHLKLDKYSINKYPYFPFLELEDFMLTCSDRCPLALSCIV